MSREDWTTAFDDALTGRVRTCTVCGRREGRHWGDLAMVGPLAVAYTLCERCRDSDPERARLNHVLAQRYGTLGPATEEKRGAQKC